MSAIETPFFHAGFYMKEKGFFLPPLQISLATSFLCLFLIEKAPLYSDIKYKAEKPYYMLETLRLPACSHKVPPMEWYFCLQKGVCVVISTDHLVPCRPPFCSQCCACVGLWGSPPKLLLGTKF